MCLRLLALFEGLQKLGRLGLNSLESMGRSALFLFFTLLGAAQPPFKLRPILRQIHVIGSGSFLVIMFTGAFVGMVLGLQGYYTLSKYGSSSALGAAVALSLIRELGPVLTALMVIGRTGSAMCAELGIMRISEQIDALDCMAINPYRYLVAPKLIAGLLSIPLLTAVFNLVGVFGGYMVGVVLLHGNGGAYMASMRASVTPVDLQMCFVKSVCFAFLLVWICAEHGFWVNRRPWGFGAEGVSRATTSAVVVSSVSVLVADYVITSFMM